MRPSLTGSSNISAATDGVGNAGTISISNAIEVFLDGGSSISTAILTTGIATQPSNININTQRLILTNNSEITASTSGKGDAGNITIPNAQEISLNNSQISASTSGEGNTGEINLTATGTNTLLLENNSQISSSVEKGAIGNSEQIILNTPHLRLTNNSQISAATAGAGNAGSIIIPNAVEVFLDGGSTISTAILSTCIATLPSNININTQRLSLSNNSEITASTSGRGEAGSVNLEVADNINLTQNSIISSAANLGATGDGGDITITTPNLNLNLNSQISVSSNGQPEADAGEITITVNQLNLDSNAQISGSTSAGTGGSITINANELIATNGGQIRTTTSGSESAGDIILFIASETILSGAQTGLFADTSADSTGEGGNIFLSTPELLIEQGATIGVDSLGEGEGGNITILADNVNLDRGTISAETTSGDGGNIEMTIANFLNLRQGSQISTTAGNQQQGGDGGNITILARFIFAIPEENSDITANAFTGRGGQIAITTEVLFGIQPRDFPTFVSDITASSELGIDGTIEINRLYVNPLEGLTNLPSTPAEVEVAQGCEAGGEGSVEFYDLGRGGLPAQPGDFLTSETIPWIPLTIETEENSWRLTETIYAVFSTPTPMGNLKFSCQKF